MDKTAFLDILKAIVEGFEDPGFKSQFAEARAAGDVAKMTALPLAIQERAFARHGLESGPGTAAFKEAGRSFASDPEALPLLARMKSALK